MNISRIIRIVKKNTSLRDVYISLVSIIVGIVLSFVFSSGLYSTKHNMASNMDIMTKSLMGLTGKDLEKKFLEEMITHHQGAISMSKIILESKSGNLKLENTASKIIKVQEREIEDMTNWLKEYN